MDHQYVIMVTMTTDAPGHRTPDTGQPPRPALRAPVPDNTIAGVPQHHITTGTETGHGTRDTRPETVPPAAPDVPLPDTRDVPQATGRDTTTGHRTRDTGPDGVPRATGRDTTTNGTRDTRRNGTRDTRRNGTRDTRRNGTPPKVSRDTVRFGVSRLAAAYRTARDTRKALQRDTIAARTAERDTAARDAAAARDALAREASTARRRRTGPASPQTDAERLAPIPDRMVRAGIWLDRGAAFIVPTAPLLVSGWATIGVGRDEPLSMGWMAVAFTLGLEGAVWYLSKLREQFKLEGDGTFSINLVISAIITLIFGLIAGHAIWNHAGRQPLDIHVPGVQVDVPLSEVMPAIAVALMSAIGNFVWAKKATYRHRAKLRAMRLIDPRAPKFALGRWAFAPRETFCALRHAFRYGITEAGVAVSDWRTWRATGKPKIWPVPHGFRYDQAGKLVEMSAEELRDAAARDALIDALTERDTEPDGRPAGTGHPTTGRPAALNGTPDTGTGHPATGRPVTANRTPDTATGHRPNVNGTLFTGRPVALNGTPDAPAAGHPRPINGTPDAGHRTRDTSVPAPSNGTLRAVNGTPAADTDRTPAGSGTRDSSGTPDAGNGTPVVGAPAGGRLTADDLETLKRDAPYVVIVAAANPGWADLTKRPPSVRKIISDVHEYRVRTDSGSFNSRDIASRIQGAIQRCREDPTLFDRVCQIEGVSPLDLAGQGYSKN